MTGKQVTVWRGPEETFPEWYLRMCVHSLSPSRIVFLFYSRECNSWMAASIFWPRCFGEYIKFQYLSQSPASLSKCHKVTYPAVLLCGIDFHVSAIIWIFQQAVILKKQPGALPQTFTLVVMVLLDKFLHQLEQTLGVPSVPLDEVLRRTPAKSHETLTVLDFLLEPL